MIVATAGHVDHGKTALVRALTGKDTDTLAEEKRRGLTINLGFAYFDAGSHRIGFVDVPGHHKFIRNMLAGVAGIDAVLLVIAADESVMPQTREHLRIVELLGLRRGIVVINKIDRADDDMRILLEDEVADFTRDTFLQDAPVIRTAATTGHGLDELTGALIDIASTLSERSVDGNFRLAVDRAFTLKGSGLVVTGTVHSGRVAKGAELIVLPGGRKARIRGIYSEERPAEVAAAGHRCALNLSGVDLVNIHRGCWLTAPDCPHMTDRVDVRLRLPADAQHPIKHWTPVHVFHGTAHVTGRVALMENPTLEPGESCLGQFVLDEPIAATRGDVCILRNQAADETLGGGEILDIFPPTRGRARPARVRELRAVEAVDPHVALEQLMAVNVAGLPLEQFRINWNLTSEEADTVFDNAGVIRVAVDGTKLGMASAAWDGLRDELVDGIRDHHEQQPHVAGPRVNELVQRLGGRYAAPLVGAALQALVHDNAVIQRGPYFALPRFRPRLEETDRELWTRLHTALKAAGNRPPVIDQLAESVDEPSERIASVLESARQLGHVEAVGKNRFFLTETLNQLADVFTEMAADGESVSTADFRDRSELGRNLAIDVLEHFDSIGLSMRIGDVRRATTVHASVNR